MGEVINETEGDKVRGGDKSMGLTKSEGEGDIHGNTSVGGE